MRWALPIIIGMGLALRIAHFWAISGTAYPDIPLVATELDMYATYQWAQTILAGDLIGRDTYHPYFQWMKDIAPLETWYRWWGGKEIFQQAPLYAYVVALLLWLSSRSLECVLLIQLVLGALHPLVMYGLAKQLFDARVGLVAAVLTAFYGPFIFHQGTLLRDWIPPILEPFSVLLILRAQATGRAATWLSAGMVFGLALLTKEAVLLYFPMVLLWIVFVNRRSLRAAGRAGGFLLLGFMLVLSPLVWRNAVVGTSLFSISNRAPEGFIEGNAPDTYPISLHHPTSMAGILERSNGRVWPVIQETLALYHGDWRLLINQMILKARGIVDPIEVPNNLDFGYALDLSPPLRLTLRYGLIFPIGLAGMIVSLRLWRSHLPFLLYGLAAVAGLMSTIVIARYRLVLAPVLLVYGAATLVWLWDVTQQRRWGRVFGGLGLILVVAVLQHLVVPIPLVGRHPIVTIYGPEYIHSSQLYSLEGRFDQAAAEMTRLRRKASLAPDFPKKKDFISQTYFWEGNYRVQWANQLFEKGMEGDARRQVALAQAAYAEHIRRNYSLGLTFRPLFELEDPASAEALFKLLLGLNPQHPSAADLQQLIRRLEQ